MSFLVGLGYALRIYAEYCAVLGLLVSFELYKDCRKDNRREVRARR